MHSGFEGFKIIRARKDGGRGEFQFLEVIETNV